MGKYTQTMSWIDRRKRAPDVPLKLWRVDCAGFWDEALKKESRLRLQTSRESVARQKKENPECLESQGGPKSTGARQSEDRSYGQSQTHRFSHERSDDDPNHRFRRPPTSSMEIGWNSWGEVKRLKNQTRSPRKQSAMSNYADKMLLPAGAPCSIGNVGGNDGAWRTNVIQTLSA